MRVLVTALAGAVAATAMTVASPAQATPTVLQRRAEGMLVADLGMHVVGVGYQHMASPWVSGQLVLAYYQPWTQNIDFLGLSGEANKGGDLRGGVVRARVFFHPAGGATTDRRASRASIRRSRSSSATSSGATRPLPLSEPAATRVTIQ